MAVSLKLGEAFVELTTQGDEASLRQKMQREATNASRGVTAKVKLDVDRPRDARGRFMATGREAGEGFNDGFSRAVGGARTANTLNNVLRQMGGSLNFLNFGGPTSGALAFAGAASGAAAAAAGLAGTLGMAAATSIAVIPALFGVGAAAATIKLGFSGVSEALKAYSAQQAQVGGVSTKAAQVEMNNAAAIRSAQEQIADARKQQARTAREAAEQIRDAEMRVADAQDRSREAQEDLNEARKDAVQRIKDLKRESEDAVVDEGEAKARLERAKLTLQQMENDPERGSPQLVLEARAALAKAEQDYKNAQDKTKTSAKEATDAAKKGVEGDKQVIDAKKRLKESHEDEKEATRDLNLTKIRAGEQQEDAAIAVARAQRALRDTQVKNNAATIAGTSATNKYADAMAKLTPEGRAFVKQLIVMKGLIDKLKKTAERNMLPGLTDGLKSLETLFPIVDKYVGRFGRTIGNAGRDLGKYFESPAFKSSLTNILENNADAFDTLGEAVVPIARILTNVSEAAAPLIPRFADVFTNSVKLFDAWIQKKKDSGDLAKFFDDAGDALGKVWGVLKDVDYQKLASVVASTIQLTGGLMAFKFAATHPFFAIMGLLATKYPQETADVLDKASTVMMGALKWISDNPAAAGTMLAILGAYKGLSAIGNIKLPDIFAKTPGLKAFTERGSSASNALWVKVVGGIGSGSGGSDVDVDKDGKKVGDDEEVGPDGKKRKRKGKSALTGGSITFGTALGSLLANWLGDDAGVWFNDTLWPPMQHWFTITLPNFLNAGVGQGGWSGFMNNLGRWFGETLPGSLSPGTGKGWSGLVANTEHWFSHTLPDALNLGDNTGWSGLGANFGTWWGTTLPGLMSPGEGPGWDGLVGDTERWFSHTLPDALNLGKGSGWSGLKENLGNWFGQTLPDALSPGAGGGWSGAGKRWKDQAKSMLGLNMIQGLWDGVKEKGDTLKTKISGWKDTFVGWWKNSFGIKSPSTVFATLGREMINGVWGGLTGKWADLKKSVNTWINDKVKKPLSDGFKGVGTGMKNALTGAFSTVAQALIGPANSIIGMINRMIGLVNKPIPDQWDIGTIPSIPVPRKASGGRIAGPGTGTSDDVLMYGSNGEWVIREKAVNALQNTYGADVMHRLNNADKYDVSGDPGTTNIRKFANGGLIQRTQNFIRGTDPLPYVWAAVGPNGYDCSGITGEVFNRLTGRSSYQRRFTTRSNFEQIGFRPGKGTYTIGVSNGHMVGNLAGLAFEAASTRSGIKIGGNAKSVDRMQRQYFLPEVGGEFIGGGGGQDNSPGFIARQALKVYDKLTGPLRNQINDYGNGMGFFDNVISGVGNRALDGIRKKVEGISLFDNGGLLMPGTTLVQNNTGKPEAVLTNDQMRNGLGTTINIAKVELVCNDNNYNSIEQLFSGLPSVVKQNSVAGGRN